MYKTIASSLFLHKKCSINGIGTLSMVPHSALIDFLTNRIQAPTFRIEFIPNSNEINLLSEFIEVSNFIKNKLENDGSVLLYGIGTFTKFSNGKLDFYPITIDPIFIPVINAEKTISEESVPDILKEDIQQTTVIEMDEYVNTNETTFERWKISAIVLFSISLLIIIIYITQRGINLFGNISGF